MLTLFHAPKSRSSRIIWLLEELGAPYELRTVNITRGDGSGAHDESNPHPEKKVPALVHDGALLTESAAIVLYLTDLFPDAGIGPTIGDPKRGPYLTWLAYYQGVMEPILVSEWTGVADNAGLQRNYGTKDTMHARVLAALGKGPYMLGETFSGADILVGSLGQWFRSALPSGDPVDSYLARIAERPALARAMAKDG